MPKYPLLPLLEHRERRVDDATAALGHAIRAREAANRVHEGAELDRSDAEARAHAVRSEEAARLVRGELTAADLARAGAWEIAARAEKVRLDEAVQAAERNVDARVVDETDARGGLAGSMTDRDVIEKDQSRFEARAKARVVAAEEEAAEEAWMGKRR